MFSQRRTTPKPMAKQNVLMERSCPPFGNTSDTTHGLGSLHFGTSAAALEHKDRTIRPSSVSPYTAPPNRRLEPDHDGIPQICETLLGQTTRSPQEHITR
eukprot:IDg21264t1